MQKADESHGSLPRNNRLWALEGDYPVVVRRRVLIKVKVGPVPRNDGSLSPTLFSAEPNLTHCTHARSESSETHDISQLGLGDCAVEVGRFLDCHPASASVVPESQGEPTASDGLLAPPNARRARHLLIDRQGSAGALGPGEAGSALAPLPNESVSQGVVFEESQ